MGFLSNESDKRKPSVVFLLLVLFPAWGTLALPGETLRRLSAETDGSDPSRVSPLKSIDLSLFFKVYFIKV